MLSLGMGLSPTSVFAVFLTFPCEWGVWLRSEIRHICNSFAASQTLARETVDHYVGTLLLCFGHLPLSWLCCSWVILSHSLTVYGGGVALRGSYWIGGWWLYVYVCQSWKHSWLSLSDWWVLLGLLRTLMCLLYCWYFEKGQVLLFPPCGISPGKGPVVPLLC